MRHIAALYSFDNQLYALEGNGKMVREALENAARYFLTCPGDCSHVINSQFYGFNYDMAAGVEYEIDVSRPVRERIQNLWRNCKPLADDEPLRLAVKSY